MRRGKLIKSDSALSLSLREYLLFSSVTALPIGHSGETPAVPAHKVASLSDTTVR